MFQVVPKLNTANIRPHKNSQILWTTKFKDFVEYFVKNWIICFGRFCKKFLKISFERLPSKSQNLFKLFEN